MDIYYPESQYQWVWLTVSFEGYKNALYEKEKEIARWYKHIHTQRLQSTYYVPEINKGITQEESKQQGKLCLVRWDETSNNAYMPLL